MSETPQSSTFVFTEPIKVSLADGRKGVAITSNKDHADRTDAFDYAARGVLPWLNSSHHRRPERPTDVQPVIVMNQLPKRIFGQIFLGNNTGKLYYRHLRSYCSGNDRCDSVEAGDTRIRGRLRDTPVRPAHRYYAFTLRLAIGTPFWHLLGQRLGNRV